MPPSIAADAVVWQSGKVQFDEKIYTQSITARLTVLGVQCEPTERLDYVASPLRRRKWDPPGNPQIKT